MTDQEKEFIVNSIHRVEKNVLLLKSELDLLVESMKKANVIMKAYGDQLNDLEIRVRRLEESHE